MCRIALIHNGPANAADEILALQSNGGNRPGKIWSRGHAHFVFNRFDVTTAGIEDDVLPLRGDRFEISYNGEVFGFRDERYSASGCTSDVHYALGILESHGIEAFCEWADLQGTFLIHELATNDLYILADQLNTCGAFYAISGDLFVFAQEVAIVERALRASEAPGNVPIHTLPNGHYLRISLVETSALPQVHAIRCYGARVFEGRDESSEAFWHNCIDLQGNLVESTIRRIPRNGPVAVLCGGGVDSSCILAIVAEHLRKTAQLDRLFVYCFGAGDLDVPIEADDLANTRFLLAELGIGAEKLVVLGEHHDVRRWLYETQVFCEAPRLVTPNPILNTQVRHSVRMSLTLSEIVRKNPAVRVVLTGDVADEIFAGYHSMRLDVKSARELADRLRMKLDDLPLNDAARFTLASLFGVCAIIREFVVIPCMNKAGLGRYYDDALSQEQIRESLTSAGALTAELDAALDQLHPIEIRTPFSSHVVLAGLQTAHPDFLVGEFDGRMVPKFLLRVAAHQLGVPSKIAARPKVPFNEGGSGIRNDQRDDLETQSAERWREFGTEAAQALVSGQHLTVLRRLNLLPTLDDKDKQERTVRDHFAQLALYQAARCGGLDRLVEGGSTFRPWMPDSVYSTNEVSGAYAPQRPFSYNSEMRRFVNVEGHE